MIRVNEEVFSTVLVPCEIECFRYSSSTETMSKAILEDAVFAGVRGRTRV